MEVTSLSLRVIYDSRVNPTVEAEINDHTAAAPSGASTGSHEAASFVPDDLDGIERRLRERVIGEQMTQEKFDYELRQLDGTEGFDEIGSVAIASSLAFKKAIGIAPGNAFPFPMGNLVGGGAHGGNTAIQEFLIIPSGAESIPAAMRTLSEMFHAFRDAHRAKIRGTNDEGAFITTMDDEETLVAVRKLADEYGADVGIDVAATEFYREDAYYWDSLGIHIGPNQQIKMLEDLIDTFGLVYVEDPLHEDDFEHTALLTERTRDCLIAGDDLFVTDAERLEQAAQIEAGNATIIKPNQVGTITDTEQTLARAVQHGFTPIISHRSGETCDPVITQLAREWQIPLIKSGISGIRTAKNNQLLREWDRAPGRMTELPF